LLGEPLKSGSAAALAAVLADGGSGVATTAGGVAALAGNSVM
jgi:hypothetical protein